MSGEADSVLPVIGLEIHAELKTRTKLFCRCASAFGAPPNSLVCPVCLGLPGALPVLNAEAVRLSVIAGLALGSEILPFTKWDRKSYYYPDLPKNYQISQYDLPLCRGGALEVQTEGRRLRVRIVRAHLEEDAGKNVHERSGTTGVDLNRAGVPLLEIVTEPDLHGVAEVSAFAREIHRILRWIGVSEANMERGQTRFEPNINLHVRRGGVTYETPITEVKNLNSFRSLEATVAYEIDRQYEAWRADPEGYVKGRAHRENRGYDVEAGVTVFQRGKEEAHDYRYFPDPDLAPVTLERGFIERLRASLGEMPAAREARFREDYGLSDRDAALLTEDQSAGELLDAAVELGAPARRVSTLLRGAGARIANERGIGVGELGMDAPRLAELAKMAEAGDLTSTAAVAVFAACLASGERPGAAATRMGVLATRDAAAVEGWVRQALEANPKAVSDVRERGRSEKKAFGFLVGQVMQLSRGAASPEEVQRLLRQALYPGEGY